MEESSVLPDAAEAAPSSPDRVASLSARISEALTSVGIAVRRREAEIELVDRTLVASSGAQSAAARQAADRMARMRAEHADELSILQRARRALEEASSDAGELSYELDTRLEESQQALDEARELRRTTESLREEAEELRRTTESLREEADEQRARVAGLEASLRTAEEDKEQTQRALAARESELEQLWQELAAKTREAEELASLMGAFTTGSDAGEPAPVQQSVEAPADAVEAEAVEAQAGEAHAGEMGPVEGNAREPRAVEGEALAMAAVEREAAESEGVDDGVIVALAPPVEETAADPEPQRDPPRVPHFEEAPDIEASTDTMHDVMDELAGVDALAEGQTAVDVAARDETAAVVENEPPAAVDPPRAEVHFEEAPSVELPPPVFDTTAEGDAAEADPAGALDISVDDWGAVVEEEPAVAAAPAAQPSPARDGSAIDAELHAYLSAVGNDEPAPQPSAGAVLDENALFKATSPIAEFHCANADEVRLAGALQLQSWRSSELARLLGLDESAVREKLESYRTRGLVEVVAS